MNPFVSRIRIKCYDTVRIRITGASDDLILRTFNIFVVRSVAERGIYPAVDPLDSTSRIMDPNVIGPEHYGVARGVQKILQVCLSFWCALCALFKFCVRIVN